MLFFVITKTNVAIAPEGHNTFCKFIKFFHQISSKTLDFMDI